MNPYATHLLYKNVFDAPLTESATSRIILAADFKNLQFSILPGAIVTLESISGTFKVGELVTGGTSGSTGYVAVVNETSLILTAVSADFDVAETITGDDSGATADVTAFEVPDFSVKAFKSNQNSQDGVMNPPDPALPNSITNEYEQIMYTGEPGGINYDTLNPFNPTDSGTTDYSRQTFQFQTNGAVWVFLETVITSGALVISNIDLFNQ